MNKSYTYRILILNGVNLSQLGSREINIYGQVSFDNYLEELRGLHTDSEIEYLQEDDEVKLATFIANAKDYVRRIRNHPSIVLYCGRNEGVPPVTLDNAIRSMLPT